MIKELYVYNDYTSKCNALYNFAGRQLQVQNKISKSAISLRRSVVLS